MHYDIVLHNCTVLTVNPDFDVINDGIICIRDSLIKKVQTRPADKLPAAQKTIDARGAIVLPGLVNTHTHLPMTLFRGLADDLPLHEWLEKYIFPAENKHLTPDSVRIGSQLACAEMIMSGTTMCCDGYFLEDHVAAAVSDSGLRAILGQGVIDFAAPGISNPSDNIKHAAAYTQKWLKRSPLIKPSIFCHSPYTCSGRTLQAAKSTADANHLLFQIHAAETREEKDRIFAEHGESPIQYLDRNGVLDENTLLVHCVWINDDDIDTIAKRNARVSHNPVSNMKLASGIAPVEKLLQAGIPVGLGTDGSASGNSLDLFGVMDICAKLHKVHRLDPTVLDARTVLQMATIGGARAIGMDNIIGSLEAGKKADLIVVDTRKPHLTPMYHPTSHLVYAANGGDVTTVIINGQLVMEDGGLISMDLDDIMNQATGIAGDISY